MAEYAFAAYQFAQWTSVVLRRADGVLIPTDPGNTDYIAYLAWSNAGGITDPLTPVYDQTDNTFSADPWSNIIADTSND
jgi:hypothetical protein